MKSIRQELTYRLLISLLLLVLCGCVLLYGVLRRALTIDFDDALLARARALASLVMQEADGRIEFEYAEPAAPRSHHGLRVQEMFEIWLADGRPLSRSAALGARDLSHPPIADAPRMHFANMHLPDGRRGRAVSLRFTPLPDPDPDEPSSGVRPGRPPGEALLTLALDRTPLDRTLWLLVLTIGGVGLLLPMGITLIVRREVTTGLAPLARVANEAAAIDSRNLAYRFTETDLPRELRPITGRLNDLLVRMEAAFARERRFTSAAAHELRTPIAELHSLAEVALLAPEDQALAQTSLGEALAISRQMERLVATLLALARCEAGRQLPVPEDVDLGELVTEAWAVYAEPAQARQLNCSLTVAPGLILRTDRALLLSVLHNLFANAVAHASASGRVDIQAGNPKGRICLTVANTIDTLTPDDLPHLCEPFWRKDGARTGDTHSGLGLTLVTAICRTLAIDFSITCKDPTELLAKLTFPLNVAD